MTALLVTAAAIGALLTPGAQAAPTHSMWPVFDKPAKWTMRSSRNGHVTHFEIRHLAQWGCWRGDIIDLVTVKQAPEDYWGPNEDVVGHQIIRRAADGSWLMVGTYTESPNPAAVWTMQIHRYPGKPVPYVIIPAKRTDSDTRTEYFTRVAKGRQVSWCMTRNPPKWGYHIYWRSRFHFTANRLVASYEENRGCGPVACQMEKWQFTPDRAGIARLVFQRSAGRNLPWVLSRLNDG